MVMVPGTRQEFRTLDEWRELHYSRLTTGRASRHEYRRQAAIFAALRPWMVRQCEDLDGLRRLHSYLYADIGVGFVRFDAADYAHGLSGYWREHLAELRIETHNRIHQLETGAAFRDRVRHGPADPERMPDRALDRVIQTCRDAELVARCRAEKARRMNRTDETTTGEHQP